MYLLFLSFFKTLTEIENMLSIVDQSTLNTNDYNTL